MRELCIWFDQRIMLYCHVYFNYTTLLYLRFKMQINVSDYYIGRTREFFHQGETLALIWDIWYSIEGDREVYPVFWYIIEYGVTILLKALGSWLDLTELGHFCLVWGVHFFKYIVFRKLVVFKDYWAIWIFFFNL